MGRKKHKGNIVYSTDPDFDAGYQEDEDPVSLEPSAQNLRIWKDRLKGNKVATRVVGFQGPESELKDLGRQLKQLCGCGGAVKNQEILLQGDFREKVRDWLQNQGFPCKLAGG